jgi:HSP20 family molecular chaperone IbpA
MSPQICAYSDEEEKNLKIEIELPGVKKENIKLKMEETGFYIDAKKEDVEYLGTFALCCPILPKQAKAHYQEGLLKVEVPYKETVEKALDVPIK